jgi:hypothetical protein
MIIALALLFVKLDLGAIAAPLSEYERYVHNYSNWTNISCGDQRIADTDRSKLEYRLSP